MVFTRSQSHLRSINNNSKTRNRSPSVPACIRRHSSNEMLRTIKVHFNKNQQSAPQESPKVSSLTINSLQSTSLASQSQASQSKVESSTTLKMQEAEIPSICARFRAQCIRILRFVQSVLGVIGGGYAVYRIYETYIVPREERMEVLVLRRS